jgi:signal transduction histidine kinase
MSDIEKNYEDFISTVSHELRTPLTSIRGFSQTLLSSWDRLDDENKKKFIKIIEEQSNRLIHLIENMLSVTKLQSDNNTFIYNNIAIKAPIEQIITLVKAQYRSRDFVLNCPQNIEEIFVDRDRFQQIMTNLIENSAKYSVENSKIFISAINKEDFVQISVTNQGIGLEEKDYETIFTKFARIDNPLTRKVQGSGLGLYITKNLVEKMGGTISVKSTPLGDNSNLSEITFTVLLPIKTLEEQARLKCKQ